MVFGSQHSRTILRSQVPSTKTTGDGLNSIKNVVSFGRLARGSHIARSRMGKNGHAADITGMTESDSTSDIGAPPPRTANRLYSRSDTRLLFAASSISL